MNNQVPNTLKGFRDLLPAQKRQRDYVAGVLRGVFETFGFEPLETPTLEYATLLTGKYGDEADKLMYIFEDRGQRQVGLRYDQTVPTARVLAQYQNQLPRTFRRYQIQNVFRADKPQQGRFREFTQCDCDVFGSTSPIADAEILAVFYQAYAALGITSLVIEVNDRQPLVAALTPFANEAITVASIIQSLDKLDKVSAIGVIEELVAKGMNADQAQVALTAVQSLEPSPTLSKIMNVAMELGVPAKALEFNPALARGLDYYTGLIFEGKIPEYGVGSVGGGGRYDNLLAELAGLEMPAVGFGLGFDRTVEAAVQLGLVPDMNSTSQVLVTVFDETSLPSSLSVAAELRRAGIRTEVYPGVDKLAKQFKVADQKRIPYVIVIGDAEVANSTLSVKNLLTGDQSTMTVAAFINSLQS